MNYNTQIAPDGLPAMLSLSYGEDFAYSIGYIPQTITRGIRGDCRGWTSNSTTGLFNFTKAIIEDKLTGYGFAITLTFRDCPETAAAMHKVRRKFIKRLERRGLIRLLWVCEFQERKVPHFHMAAYFKTKTDTATGLPLQQTIINLWCDCAKHYNVKPTAQTCKDITDLGGWMGYFNKHIDRGIYHYQRQRDTLPPGWREKTGHVWHWVGDWPRDLKKLHFSGKKFRFLFQFRDCEQKRQIANCRMELAHLSGSHFSFIGHRRHFYLDGTKIKKRFSRAWICHYIYNRLDFISDNYAAHAAKRADTNLFFMPRHRRKKKRVFSPARKKQFELSLSHYPAHKRQKIMIQKRNKLSALRGVRGALSGGKGAAGRYVNKVLDYQRGFRDKFGEIRAAD